MLGADVAVVAAVRRAAVVPVGVETAVAEAATESAAGHVGSEVFDALTEIAVWLPKP